LDIAPFETVQLDALLRGPLQVFGQPTIHTIKFRAEGMKLDSSADYTLVQKAWLGRSVKPYVVVLAAALAIFMLWPRYLVLGDFRGQELDTVNEILEEAGITPEIREQNSTQQAGTVIETMPVAGERVRIGGVLGFLSDPVEIVASSGPKTLPIPDVFNKLEAAAVAALGELDALGVEIEYESRPSEQIADGFVMGTEPASGSLQSGDTLKVVVSSGPEDVPVPDFTGETSEGALVVAEAARLKTRDVPLPVTDPSQNNLVVDQLPKPGELVMVGRTVIVYIGVFEDPGESTTTTAAG
jgi:beta-lactam-binding protein with PASTA domain